MPEKSEAEFMNIALWVNVTLQRIIESLGGDPKRFTNPGDEPVFAESEIIRNSWDPRLAEISKTTLTVANALTKLAEEEFGPFTEIERIAKVISIFVAVPASQLEVAPDSEIGFKPSPFFVPDTIHRERNRRLNTFVSPSTPHLVLGEICQRHFGWSNRDLEMVAGEAFSGPLPLPFRPKTHFGFYGVGSAQMVEYLDRYKGETPLDRLESFFLRRIAPNVEHTVTAMVCEIIQAHGGNPSRLADGQGLPIFPGTGPVRSAAEIPEYFAALRRTAEALVSHAKKDNHDLWSSDLQIAALHAAMLGQITVDGKGQFVRAPLYFAPWGPRYPFRWKKMIESSSLSETEQRLLISLVTGEIRRHTRHAPASGMPTRILGRQAAYRGHGAGFQRRVIT